MATAALDRPSPVAIDLDRLIALGGRAGGHGRAGGGLSPFPGPARARRKGQGLDFEDLRLYQEGDDTRFIDWNVTARTGVAHLKTWREERERVTLVAVDLRAAMRFGSTRLKSVAAAETAALLAWSAAAAGDRVGGLVVAEGGLSLVEPRAGDRGVLDLLGRLADPPTGAAAPTLADALDRVTALGRRAGFAVLLTDGDEPGTGFDAAAARLAAVDRLALVLVDDPLERAPPPPGHYPFAHALRRGLARVGGRGAERIGECLDASRRALLDRFGRTGARLAEIGTETDVDDAFARLARAGLV